MIFAAVQTSAEMCVELRKPAGKQRLENGIGVRKFGGQNKGSGQLIYLPVQRALAVDGSRFLVYGAGRCQTRNSFLFVGVPFSDVSFRAFTASPNVEKGTPTTQPFDNRSIA